MLMGTKYGHSMYEGLSQILETARLDDKGYNVINWFYGKGRLIIYITRK